MGDWTWLIIVVVVIVFVTLWLYLAVKRRNAAIAAHGAKTETASTDPNYTFEGVAGAERFGPAVLAAGVRVTFRGETYLVGGTAALREGDRIWYEHLLQGSQGGGGRHWISVENIDDRIRLGWWSIREDLPGESGSQLTLDGRVFRQEREGDADFAVSGLSGAVSRGTYRYRDFTGDHDHGLLRIETWGEDARPEASTGHYIDHDELEVVPPREG
ncbi:DUF4178 domain-containing protein [Corynebacterium halotolerans]|uniref:DUF4178 domain-containing protein n=1 Tax=Corynebacterium halotolerans YIM 70093 = DSM 44683 TaxID=1121362 RepID=M1NQ00_9CORY|nr:DUF4178 domain-containing protein [Corynebacterium halotolerans]AGF73458.1 hypothetical protein A605_12310 [Corynebacterium halotolerans YIM 70093 = DSM 44683]